jgi:hypothetical protein
MKKILAGAMLLAALVLSTAALAADTVQAAWAPSLLWDPTGFSIPRNATVYKNLSAVVITAETTIWTPAAGKKFRVMGFCLTQGVATGAVTLKDNTAGTTILIIPQNTLGQAICMPIAANGIQSATAANVLTATGVSTETLTGFVYGTEE